MITGFLLDGFAPTGDHFGDFGNFGLELMKSDGVSELLFDESANVELGDCGDSTGFDEVNSFVGFGGVFGHDEEF